MLNVTIHSDNPSLSADFRLEKSTAVLGPSGAGKTTLLRCIAGVHPYTGTIYVDGICIDAALGPKRNVGLAWQDYRVLPHLTVLENITLGGSVNLDEYVSLLSMSRLLGRKAAVLSGGELQRVNLLRALCSKSSVVLLDEPLSNTDILSTQSLSDILLLIEKSNRLALYVSHNLSSVYGVLDQAIIVKNCNIEAIGPIQDLYENPTTEWLAGFFGQYVIFNRRDMAMFRLKNPCLVRKEWFSIHKDLCPNSTISDICWRGGYMDIKVMLDETLKVFTVSGSVDASLHIGDRVYVDFKKYSCPAWL